jgi:hypothetical protein
LSVSFFYGLVQGGARANYKPRLRNLSDINPATGKLKKKGV